MNVQVDIVGNGLCLSHILIDWEQMCALFISNKYSPLVVMADQRLYMRIILHLGFRAASVNSVALQLNSVGLCCSTLLTQTDPAGAPGQVQAWALKVLRPFLGQSHKHTAPWLGADGLRVLLSAPLTCLKAVPLTSPHNEWMNGCLTHSDIASLAAAQAHRSESIVCPHKSLYLSCYYKRQSIRRRIWTWIHWWFWMIARLPSSLIASIFLSLNEVITCIWWVGRAASKAITCD